MTTCPNNWINAISTNMGCLYIKRITKVTWDTAKKICDDNQNAFLVEILTKDQMDFIVKVLGSIDGGGNFWTGGTDEGREGQWYWTTSKKALEDFVFHRTQPNQGNSANCMILGEGYGGFHGADEPCSIRAIPIYYCSNCIVIKSRTFKVKMYNCQSIENQNDFLLEILTTDQMQMDFLAKDLDTMNKAGKYCTGGKETQV